MQVPGLGKGKPCLRTRTFFYLRLRNQTRGASKRWQPST